MNYLGQCPECRSNLELSSQAPGCVLRCQCGQSLVASDMEEISEIPVSCIRCEGEYVFDRAGAGETVGCQCGHRLTVPTMILAVASEDSPRSPATIDDSQQPSAQTDDASAPELTSTHDEPTDAATDEPTDAATEEPNDEPIDQSTEEPIEDNEDGEPETEPRSEPMVIVRCPGCENEYEVPGNEVGDEAECECGSVFIMGSDRRATDLAMLGEFNPHDPFEQARLEQARQDRSPTPVALAPEKVAPDKVVPEKIAEPIPESCPAEPESRPIITAPEPTKTQIEFAPRQNFQPQVSSGENGKRNLARWLIVASTATLVTMMVAAIQRGSSTNEKDMSATTAAVVPIPEKRVGAVDQIMEPPSLDTQVAIRPQTTKGELLLAKIELRVEQLESKEIVTREELSHLAEMIEPLSGHSSVLTPETLTWLGKTWQQLAAKPIDPILAERCRQQAAAAFKLARALTGASDSQENLSTDPDLLSADASPDHDLR